MDFDRVAAWRRFLGSVPSRREVLRGLAGAGLGVAAVRLPDVVEAKRKRKHKSKKPKPNAFGCLSVGKPCKNAAQCCSGSCKGKHGEKQCRAHDSGTCDQKGPGVCEATEAEQVLCGDSTDVCVCIRTTAGSNFCAGSSDCADCQKDADCEALGLPPGTACAPAFEGSCAGTCESGMACVTPCGVESPTIE